MIIDGGGLLAIITLGIGWLIGYMVGRCAGDGPRRDEADLVRGLSQARAELLLARATIETLVEREHMDGTTAIGPTADDPAVAEYRH